MDTQDLTAAPGPPRSVHRVRARHHPLLGGLLVKEGLINRAQLERVLAHQEGIEPRPLLGQLLLDEKLITSHELAAILSKYQRMHPLGDVLVETKAISPAQLEAALGIQRRTDGPLGETLIRLGFITERQLKEALGAQLGIPFVDLDGQSVDSSLPAVISERYARHHRVLAIAKADDRIVFAMDDPTDVEVIAELQSCTGHRIDVVVATADALERAIGRVYEGREGERSVRSLRGDDDEAAGRGSTAPAPPAAVVPGREPDATSGLDGTHRAPPAARIDAVRPRLEAVRQLARSWERGIDAVEALLRERAERRAELERLADELRESGRLLARTRGELEARAQALARLRTAHAALLEEREALGHRLAELQARHDALLGEHRLAMDQIDAVLRRLRA